MLNNELKLCVTMYLIDKGIDIVDILNQAKITIIQGMTISDTYKNYKDSRRSLITRNLQRIYIDL